MCIRCKMSVRALVESVWIGGDLVSQRHPSNRQILGSRIHRMLESARETMKAEVFLESCQ